MTGEEQGDTRRSIFERLRIRRRRSGTSLHSRAEAFSDASPRAPSVSTTTTEITRQDPLDTSKDPFLLWDTTDSSSHSWGTGVNDDESGETNDKSEEYNDISTNRTESCKKQSSLPIVQQEATRATRDDKGNILLPDPPERPQRQLQTRRKVISSNRQVTGRHEPANKQG
jgi:hypothetical protein